MYKSNYLTNVLQKLREIETKPEFYVFFRTNAVQMPRLPFEDGRGHALFPIFSMLAHNCISNCRYVASPDGRFVTVRALRHIQKGESLTIDYNDVLLGNLVRMRNTLGT